jgi:hypothetical protein
MGLFATVTMTLFSVVVPLLVFIPCLARTKREGLAEYGALAQRYVREFDDKWLRGGTPADEPLVGSGDIQSPRRPGQQLSNPYRHEGGAVRQGHTAATGHDRARARGAVAPDHGAFARIAQQILEDRFLICPATITKRIV